MTNQAGQIVAADVVDAAAVVVAVGSRSDALHAVFEILKSIKN